MKETMILNIMVTLLICSVIGVGIWVTKDASYLWALCILPFTAYSHSSKDDEK